MGLIKRLKLEGYKVMILTQFDGYENFIRKDVDQIDNLFISRKGINPFVDILTIFDLLIYFIRYRPDFLLSFSIKPVIYGSIVARMCKVKSLVMITGLGTTFISESFLTKIVKILYKVSLSSCSAVFFQNIDDKNIFVNQRIVNINTCKLSPGSGVDLVNFTYKCPKRSSEIIFLLIARMIADKGIVEFVEASRMLKLNYPKARFQLLGPLGVENRTAITNSKMIKWQNEGYIEYLGETNDVVKYIENACCIVLPSYREGTSRVLLEAAAMGRPLIASNVPGCKEVIDDGVNGFLCEPRDSYSLSQNMEKMLKLSHNDRKKMGVLGRKKVEDNFSQEIVSNLYVDAIKNLS
jgi:glycosyltransferase involved in cell wall biosynthesis